MSEEDGKCGEENDEISSSPRAVDVVESSLMMVERLLSYRKFSSRRIPLLVDMLDAREAPQYGARNRAEFCAFIIAQCLESRPRRKIMKNFLKAPIDNQKLLIRLAPSKWFCRQGHLLLFRAVNNPAIADKNSRVVPRTHEFLLR